MDANYVKQFGYPKGDTLDLQNKTGISIEVKNYTEDKQPTSNYKANPLPSIPLSPQYVENNSRDIIRK